MKIREVLDKKVGDTAYSKFLITLPKDIVQESKLIGKDLKAEVQEGKIVISKD